MSEVGADLDVETLRKPSTGLKQPVTAPEAMPWPSRDTQKTQHGIETLNLLFRKQVGVPGRDTQKTQHGIETSWSSTTHHRERSRDTQKTQHGIETRRLSVSLVHSLMSRHSENPARD